MSLKLKRSGLVFFFAVIVLILEYHFWYLIGIPNFTVRALLGRYSRLGIGLLGLVFYMALLKDKVPDSIRFVCRYSVIAFVLLSIYSYAMKPSQGLFYILGGTSHYLCFLYCKPFYILLSKYKREEKFLKALNIVVFIWFIVMLFQSFLSNTSGNLILREYFQNDKVLLGKGRFENARINVLSLGVFIPIYNFYCIVCSKDNKELKKSEMLFHIVSFAFGTYCIIFITQGRAVSLAYIFGLVAIYLMKPSRGNQSILKPFIILIALFILFATGTITSFLDTFGRGSTLYVSTYKRLYEYEYFIRCFFNNPIFGHGLYYNAYSEMYNSNMGVMWNNDVGIIGMLGSTGIIGTGLFIYLIVRIIKSIRAQRKSKFHNRVFLFGMLTYLLMGSVSTLYTDPTMIMMLPILFSLSEWWAEKYNSNGSIESRGVRKWGQEKSF